MTVADLIARYRKISEYDLDGVVGAEATDADVARALDLGVLVLSRIYPTYAAVDLTPTAGTPILDLTLRSVCPRHVHRCYFLQLGGKNWSHASNNRRGLMRYREFEDADPLWASRDPGTPTEAATIDPYRLALRPAPSAAWLAQNKITVWADCAPILPSQLDLSGELAWPEHIVHHVVSAALYESCKGLVRTAEASAALSRMWADAVQAVTIERDRARGAKGYKKTQRPLFGEGASVRI